jgi:hypothetical protein
MKDMGTAARKRNFEIAMANGDEMATVYASTPEEMKRARELFKPQVRVIFTALHRPLHFLNRNPCSATCAYL